jgi:hypothetical protein
MGMVPRDVEASAVTENPVRSNTNDETSAQNGRNAQDRRPRTNPQIQMNRMVDRAEATT